MFPCEISEIMFWKDSKTQETNDPEIIRFMLIILSFDEMSSYIVLYSYYYTYIFISLDIYSSNKKVIISTKSFL